MLAQQFTIFFDIASLHRCSGRTIFFFFKFPGLVELGKCHGVQEFFSPKHQKKTATQITPTATQFNFRVAETAMQNFDSKFIPAFLPRSRYQRLQPLGRLHHHCYGPKHLAMQSPLSLSYLAATHTFAHWRQHPKSWSGAGDPTSMSAASLDCCCRIISPAFRTRGAPNKSCMAFWSLDPTKSFLPTTARNSRCLLLLSLRSCSPWWVMTAGIRKKLTLSRPDRFEQSTTQQITIVLSKLLLVTLAQTNKRPLGQRKRSRTNPSLQTVISFYKNELPVTSAVPTCSPTWPPRQNVVNLLFEVRRSQRFMQALYRITVPVRDHAYSIEPGLGSLR